MTRTRAAIVGLAVLAVAAVAVRLWPAKPWKAQEGRFAHEPAGWRAIHEGFLAHTARGGVGVVFLGDSYTEGWPAAPWARHFAPLNAVNYGIRGDGTAQVLWRVGHGELDGLTPRAVVLLLGLNNSYQYGDSAEDAARGLAAVLAAVRVKLPRTKVLLLSVLPVHDPGEPLHAWVAEFNARAAPLADGVSIRYLDVGPVFVNPDGGRKPGLYAPDRIHLADAGYDALAAAIAPALAEVTE